MSNSKLAVAGLVLAIGSFAATAHAGGDAIRHGAGNYSRHGGAAVPVPAPIPVPDTQSGYYVRLDAAYSQNSVSRYQANDPRADSVRGDSYLDNFSRFGGGVGYQFNRWFRMDAIYDVRSDVHSRGSGVVNYTIPNAAGGGTSGLIAMRDTIADNFKSTNATGLINAYMDMPVSHSFTPYVGAGIGIAWICPTAIPTPRGIRAARPCSIGIHRRGPARTTSRSRPLPWPASATRSGTTRNST
jgi:opacity protein-like surface antigen